ncbi:zinc finger protein 142-like [Zophobas morio]|uniref:zinc finger protein 142-like n=1 Tax=Zophobas morio TaxID=2755281 RepID=UPI003082E68D
MFNVCVLCMYVMGESDSCYYCLFATPDSANATAKMEAYHCKDCDFKTEVTLVFEQHINEHHGPSRESRKETPSEETSSEETSSEDSSIENYVGATYCFEPNLLLKSVQHTYISTGTEENLQSVSSLKESATYNSDFKQTDEIPLYYCAECSYRSKLQESLKYHIEISHTKKQYACDKCPYKNEQEGEWHKCQKCQFKSRAKWNLRQHINDIHLNDEDVKWFKCNKCDFKTKRGTTLKTHGYIQGCCEYSHPHPQMRSFRIDLDICIRNRNNQCGTHADADVNVVQVTTRKKLVGADE